MTVEQKTSLYSKPEAKILHVPTGQLKTSNLSIKELKEHQHNKLAFNNSDKPREEFQVEDVHRLWKMNAHLQKTNGNDQNYNVMVKTELNRETETRYKFEVENTLQEERIKILLPEILAHMRKELKNYDFEIVVHKVEYQDANRAPISGKERFDKLAKKNSNLNELLKRFNLDIEL